MSRMDEATLEFFVRDSFTAGVSDEECRRIVELLEPCRESIERAMLDHFDPEEVSWRTYRNDMWGNYVTDELNAMIAELILARPRTSPRTSAREPVSIPPGL